MPRERHPNRKISQRKRSQEKDISRERHPNRKISQEKDIPTERYLKERETDRQILLIRVRREIFHGVVSPRNRPPRLDEKQILERWRVTFKRRLDEKQISRRNRRFASTRSKFSDIGVSLLAACGLLSPPVASCGLLSPLVASSRRSPLHQISRPPDLSSPRSPLPQISPPPDLSSPRSLLPQISPPPDLSSP